jgi:hypothetical protein
MNFKLSFLPIQVYQWLRTYKDRSNYPNCSGSRLIMAVLSEQYLDSNIIMLD